MVAVIWCNNNFNTTTMLIFSCTFDSSILSIYHHIINIDCKFSCQRQITHNNNISIYFGRTIRPSHKMIPFIGHCTQHYCFTILIITCTRYHTIFSRQCNAIHIYLKLCFQIDIRCNSQRTLTFSRTIRPTYKMISIICYCYKFYLCSVIVSTNTRHFTINCLCSNIKLINNTLSNKCRIGNNFNLSNCFSRTIRPTYKMIMLLWSYRNCRLFSIFILSCSRNNTIHCRQLYLINIYLKFGS